MSEYAKLLVLFVAVVLAAVSVFAVFSDESLPQVLSDALHADESAEPPENAGGNVPENDEIRAVWVTYKEIGSMVRGKSRAEYEAALDGKLSALKELGINTLFWHTRAFCDALYLNTEFPVSEYICENGALPAYDPLETVIEKAKAAGMSVHAWVNPFRVCTDAAKIPKAAKITDLLKSGDAHYISENGVWLDPACALAQSFVLECIAELCDNYDIAGVQFDDYFYTADAAEKSCRAYNEYKAAGGTLGIRRWRTESLSAFMASVYSFIKSKNKNIVFSISPCGIPEKALNESLADVSLWCSGGYADLIVPQIYFGLLNETAPFENTAQKWADMCRESGVKLVCGLAAYKCGQVDEFAGSGKNEWAENNGILKDEYSILSKIPQYCGFSLFSLDYCVGENGNEISETEIKMLKSVLEY